MIKLLWAPLALLVMTACSQTPPQPQPETRVPRVGMANPASVYCEKLGGKLVIQRTERGEIGICHLPDGTQIDEWVLFRRNHKAE